MDYSSNRCKMLRCGGRQVALLIVCAALSLLLITSHSSSSTDSSESRSRHRLHQAQNVISVHEESHEAGTLTPNSFGVCSGRRWPTNVPPLYVITPTYPRAEQIPELTRTAQTLLHVNALVWIVAEDAPKPSVAVQEYLQSSNLCHVYLRAQMPAKYKKKKNKPRGVANRNAGLDWVRKNAKRGGVLYFADDDNSYNIKIFEEIRGTKKVSMFPVGLVTKLGVSSPIVRNGHVTGYYDGWISNRRFPVDMAGFAVNVDHFLSFPGAEMPFIVGREETKFLEQLNITDADIEPLADNCSKILVWHTRTYKNSVASEPPKDLNVASSNIQTLARQLWHGAR